MRSILSLALSSTLVLGLSLTACGSSDDTGQGVPVDAAVGGAGGGVGGAGGGPAGSGGGGPAGSGGVAAGGAAGSAVGGSGGTIAAGSGGYAGGGETYGAVQSGQYHLGPVDFAETKFHNACAPEGGYRTELQGPTGLGTEYLAGVDWSQIQGGAVCDSCLQITTGTGKTAIARVVTYGSSQGPGDLDLSPALYNAIHTGEYPRSMTWQFAKCPATGPLYYEFQTGAHIDWTSFWVRNQRVPVTKVEVKSAKHDFAALRREQDGTVNDDGGFGAGEFTVRITGVDNQVVTDTFPGFSPGQLITSTQNFQ